MITIVGAGPAGSYLAYLLSKQDKDVVVLEEHSEIGKPVQCTGIVTHSIENFFRLKKNVIANELNKVKVFSKNNNITIDINEIVLWRDKFDQYVADMAQEVGAKILLNHQFVGFNGRNSVRVKNKKNKKTIEIKTDIVVGADGVYSAVAKAAGIDSKSKNYVGMQAKVKLKMEADAFETYFGSDFPNFFGWCVPESEDVARLGVACLENAQHHFCKFLKSRTGKKDVLCWESGLIPLYDHKKTIQKDNVFLIGDAASQVKATTGGGLVPSLKATKTLSDCILNNKNYNKEFKRQSGKELLLHLRIRNALNRFSDEDYDKLLDMMSQEKVRKVLKRFDRDMPRYLVANLLLAEPRLFYFLKRIW